jgi:hypothetical protein
MISLKCVTYRRNKKSGCQRLRRIERRRQEDDGQLVQSYNYMEGISSGVLLRVLVFGKGTMVNNIICNISK